MDKYLEDLKTEFADEFCAIHIGNFTRKEIEAGFEAGYNNWRAPKRYHAFLAWEAGQRHAGSK